MGFDFFTQCIVRSKQTMKGIEMKVLKYAWIGYSSIIAGLFSAGIISIVKNGTWEELQPILKQTEPLVDWG